MHGEARRIKDHCRVHHEDKNDGFLKFNKLPPNPVYDNFKAYFEGHADRLVLNTERYKEKRGNKEDNALVDRIIEQI